MLEIKNMKRNYDIKARVNDLIDLCDSESLIQMREELTQHVPKEMLHIEEYEACEMIDNYLKSL